MSDKDKSKKKRGLGEFICEKSGLAGDEIAGGVTLEMRGRGLLLISGCKRIEKYSPCLMTMRVGHDILFVRGSGLVCTSYHWGTVSVEGVIDSVGFSEDEGK